MKKYKIGDKIKIKKDTNVTGKFLKGGMTGNVIELLKNGVCVEFDDDINGHSGSDGKGKCGHCWCVRFDDIEHINDNKIVITTDGTETLARLYEGNKVVKRATAKCSPDGTFNFETGAKIAFDRLVENKPVDKWRVVNRRAKAGDFIRLKEASFSFTKKGDIMRVAEVDDNACYVRNDEHPHPAKTRPNGHLWNYIADEYEVVEPIETPEEKPKYYNGKIVCVKSNVPYFTVGKAYNVVDGKFKDNDGDEHPRLKIMTSAHDFNGGLWEFIPYVE